MDSIAVRKDSLIEGLGNSMLNRRLGKMARTEASAFITAGVGLSNFFDVAEISSLTVNAQPEKWDAALAQGEQALRQALEYGFSQAELDEQIANLENSLEVSVQTSPTRRTPRLARQIMGAFSGESVVTTPQSGLERFQSYKADITLDAVTEAFRAGWAGLGAAPQLYMQTPGHYLRPWTKLQALQATHRTCSPCRASVNIVLTIFEPLWRGNLLVLDGVSGQPRQLCRAPRRQMISRFSSNLWRPMRLIRVIGPKRGHNMINISGLGIRHWIARRAAWRGYMYIGQRLTVLIL